MHRWLHHHLATIPTELYPHIGWYYTQNKGEVIGVKPEAWVCGNRDQRERTSIQVSSVDHGVCERNTGGRGHVASTRPTHMSDIRIK